MIIYGINPAYEAILNKRPIYNVYIDDKFKNKQILDLINESKLKYKTVSKEKLFELSNTTAHQGIVLEVKDYEYLSLNELVALEKPLKIIALDELTDPHNLGAIIRSAEAFSMSAVLISEKNQVLITPSVVKVSAGAVEKVKICLVKNLNQALIYLKKEGVTIYGTSLNTDLSYEIIPNDSDVCVVFGNEGRGLRKLVSQNCDYLVKIPMKGKINSLNVSVAGAIIMNKIS